MFICQEDLNKKENYSTSLNTKKVSVNSWIYSFRSISLYADDTLFSSPNQTDIDVILETLRHLKTEAFLELDQ